MEQFPSNTTPEESSIKKYAKKVVTAAGIFIAGSGAAQAQHEHKNAENMSHGNAIEKTIHDKTASIEQLKEASTYYNNERQWLIEILKSSVYKERLEKEGVTQEVAEKRLQNLLSTPFVVQKTLRPYVAVEANHTTITGRYLPTDSKHSKEIELAPIGYGTIDNLATAIHEGTHASTEGDVGISNYAKDLYGKAFKESSIEAASKDSLLKMPGVVISKTDLTFSLSPDAPEKTKEAFEKYIDTYQYFSDPTELDARKKALEYEMDIMGIKKYDKPFTEKHLEELKNNYLHLSLDTQQFLDHIDPEYFITIMNTIADVQLTGDTVHWNNVA